MNGSLQHQITANLTLAVSIAEKMDGGTSTPAAIRATLVVLDDVIHDLIRLSDSLRAGGVGRADSA
jgi:hypothetical protein